MPFGEIVGHRRLLGLLARAIERGSLPPSLLFAGPEGVGKRRAAIATAQALNCLNPVGAGSRAGQPVAPETAPVAFDACGECAACRRIARGMHPDVVLLEPGDTGTIKIEPVREAISQTAYRPFEGRRRVVIVDQADALGTDSQDALLKSLEEPPSSSVFILVSARADSLRPTVRSRCCRLRFSHVPGRETMTGEFREARAVALQLLREAGGSADPARRLRSARELSGHQEEKRALAAVREELGMQLRALSSLVRDLGILATRADERALANGDLRGDLESLVRSYESERTLRAFTAVDRAMAALERNASAKVVADWLALQL
jgi:DNA polymerase-3 subunit delta'